jgi:hypothetical protein
MMYYVRAWNRDDLSAKKRCILRMLDKGPMRLDAKDKTVIALMELGYIVRDGDRYRLSPEAAEKKPREGSWEPREDAVVFKNYASLGAQALSQRIGRTPRAITMRALALGAPLHQNKGKVGTARLYCGKPPKGQVPCSKQD